MSPVKTEKAKRLSRGYFVSRKFLSKKWSAEFSAWMETDWPILVSYYKLPAEGPTFKPPARPGCAPFLPIPYDTFRKGIRMVCRACSTDVRGAAEGFETSYSPVQAGAPEGMSTCSKICLAAFGDLDIQLQPPEEHSPMKREENTTSPRGSPGLGVEGPTWAYRASCFVCHQSQGSHPN